MTSSGTVTCARKGTRTVWHVRDFWQPAAARPYEALLAKGLIQAEPAVHSKPVTLTEAGRRVAS